MSHATLQYLCTLGHTSLTSRAFRPVCYDSVELNEGFVELAALGQSLGAQRARGSGLLGVKRIFSGQVRCGATHPERRLADVFTEISKAPSQPTVAALNDAFSYGVGNGVVGMLVSLIEEPSPYLPTDLPVSECGCVSS